MSDYLYKMTMKFLSKKRWHVRRLENIRKVANAEAKYREEQTKTAELRREREEERDLEALRKIQEASGKIEKQKPRLEWMYKAPIIHKSDSESENEEAQKPSILDSLKPEEKLESKEFNTISQKNLPGAVFLFHANGPKGDADIIARNDPMMAILNQQMEEEQRRKEEQELLEKAKQARARVKSDSDSDSERNRRHHHRQRHHHHHRRSNDDFYRNI